MNLEIVLYISVIACYQPFDFHSSIFFCQALEKNTDYTISIQFVSILNDDLGGFYRSKYSMPNGTTSWLAVTQFEDTGARRSFPCLDEPDKKATFNVKLGRKPNMTAITNMPLITKNESTIFYEGTGDFFCESNKNTI